MKNNLSRIPVALLVALLLGLASQGLAQPNLEDVANNPRLFLDIARKFYKWDEPAEPVKIVGPIYFVGTKGLSVYLITTSEGHIVLNTGMPGSGPMIEASIRKLGFKPEEIKLLLTGHAHIDHAGGHAYLKQLSGARIALIREEKDLFESGGKLDFHYGTSKDFEFDPVKVDQVFNDGDVIKLGDVAITALLTNGHTKGSTTFTMNALDNGTLFRVIFPNGTSVNPGYRLVNDPSYPGIADDFRRTYQILAEVRHDIWLMPHTEAFSFETKLKRSEQEGVQAWVDPEGYQRWLSAQRDRFESVLKKEQAASAK